MALREKVATVADELDAVNAIRRQGNSSQGSSKPFVQYSSKPVYPAKTSPVMSSALPDNMDWEPTGPAKAAKAGARAKWVSTEERERRKADGLCLRCGGSGHRIAGCPYQNARRPDGNQPGQAQVRRAVVPPMLEGAPVETRSNESEELKD